MEQSPRPSPGRDSGWWSRLARRNNRAPQQRTPADDARSWQPPFVRAMLELASAVGTGAPGTAREVVGDWSIDDHGVLLTEDGVLYLLDETAYEIWRMHRSGMTEDAIVNELTAGTSAKPDEATSACRWLLTRIGQPGGTA